MISLAQVEAAQKHVYAHMRPTPLIHYPLLSQEMGFQAYIKHENHTPIGAFKIRGGLNLMAHLAQQKVPGVITVTRGNHGQSVALAASFYQIPATIVVPVGNNPEKNALMRAQGAELIEHGRDFDEARAVVEELQQARGLYYVHPANEPLLVHGVGTYWLEVLHDLPAPDVALVPVGGGSGVCAAITVLKALHPATRIVGVQAANAPAVFNSWTSKQLCETESANTFADGLATRVAFAMPLRIMQEGLDAMVLVSEDDMRAAIVQLLRTTHNLAEGAGAAAVAAAWQLRESLAGQKVVMVLSGGNIDLATLRWVLSQDSNHAA
ncbi:MAG: threonine dehydratase [Candidatus Tectomicrobia bacterium]|uniref:Threonine dehydratase n=1 Tax=Tectimicrobiota bacterium TaxID=2528274 RepID=A0A937W0F5_UNCTE|nr:threonine dehydratase [Candidatus Tectomicrobia bacterium]